MALWSRQVFKSMLYICLLPQQQMSSDLLSVFLVLPLTPAAVACESSAFWGEEMNKKLCFMFGFLWAVGNSTSSGGQRSSSRHRFVFCAFVVYLQI